MLHFLALRTIYYVCLARNRSNYNRHAGSVSKFLLESLESTTGLWMSAGCLLSGGPHPCKPCALHSFGRGSCWLPSSIFPHHPSWTCGGEKSPIRCSMVKSERLRGCSSPGSWQWSPCRPSWGWLWKKPRGRCCLHHSWVCCPELRRPSWRETQGTPFCMCAVLKKR